MRPHAQGRPGAPHTRIVTLLLLLVLGCTLAAGPRPADAQPAPAAAASAAAGPPSVESFFTNPQMRNPVLSPSGRYLALLHATPGRYNVLVVLDLQDQQKSRALARFRDADIFDVHWVGDDHLIFSLTDDENGTGPIYFAPGLYAVARTGGAPWGLIKTQQPFVVDGDATRNDRRLDWNHRVLWVPQDGSREIIVGRASRGAGELTVVSPLRLNIETLRTRGIDRGNLGAVNHWLFDAAGEPRVAVAEGDGRYRVHWRGGDDNTWKLLLDTERLKVPWRPWALDDQGGLYVTRSSGKGGTRALARMDLASGQPRLSTVVDVPGFDFRGELIADRPGGRTLGVRALREAETTVWTDPAMQALQAQIDERLPGRINRLSCRQCDREDRVVFVQSWSDRDPGIWLLWSPTKGLTNLGRPRPDVDPDRMATLDFHRITARDGRSVPVWLTLPQRTPGAPPPPVVVLVHGGPMVRGGYWRWDGEAQFLASRGYAVVEPEFRGSAGYGAEHLRAGWKQWGQAMQDDIADALLWAAREGHVDGKRACIMGASYGGYATLMGLVRHPDLYRCGIAAMAVTDLPRLVEGSWWWPDDIVREGRTYDLPAMVGDPKADAEMLRTNSPLLQAARIKAPVLLVHGQRDLRVPIVHANDMRSALKEAGNEPEWLVFGDEGHGWGKLENRVTYARRVEQFLARHLQPAAAPATAATAPQGAPTTR